MCWDRLLFVLTIGISFTGCNHPRELLSDQVSFHRDIAPLLYAHCASCHRPGESAPFSLLTYDDARSRAGQIAEVTRSRFMPPWLPESNEKGHARITGQRRLSEAEIALFTRWAEAGTPAGDAKDAPPAPQFTQGWKLGEPDLVLESPPFAVAAGGKDRFRNFMLTTPHGEQHWVQAVELRPSKPGVTHHARLGIDKTGESLRRDAADDEVGYEGMAWGEDPAGQLITWTPGMQPDAGNPAAAWLLEPGTNLVLHSHLQPSGKPEIVNFRIGFYFADQPPTEHPVILRIGSRDIDIPAGEASFSIRDAYELPIDVDTSFVFPHAHSLCRQIRVQAELPTGTTQTLIVINHFDENWHDKYRFAEPARLPKGTRLTSEFTYDNSPANIRNPHHPPQRVVYGSNASDEMADIYLQVNPVNPAERAVLLEHHGQYDLASKIVGYTKHLSLHPDDTWSREALASCYVANHQPELAIELLQERSQFFENSSQAKIVLGMASLAAQDAETAETQFRAALDTEEQLPLAWLGLGQALVASDQTQEAETALLRAVELAPQLTVARLDLIDLLVAQERFEEAIRECEAASTLDPAAPQPHLKLATIYAQQNRYEQSLAQFATAKQLAPFLYSPTASLAIACYQNGDESRAERLLQQAVESEPQDPVPYCFLGQIARRNEKWPEAKELLQQSLDLPLPTTWPASHVKQFLTLVYTEQLQLAQQTEDIALLRASAEAWSRLDPDNIALKQLLHDIK